MNQGAITPPRGGAGRSRHELREWSGEALAELLLTPTSGGEAPYWQLSGVALEKVHQVMPALRKTLSQRGVMLFSLDPLGAHATMRTFSEVIDAYVMEVSRRLGLTDAIEELIEWMHASTRDELSAHDREVMQTDTLSRLWAALNEELPAALIVFHPERLASQVSHQLDYLMNAYFHDPIAELGPELGSPPRRRGTLAVVSEAGEGLKAFWGELVPREVDFTRHFEDEVRAYLTRPEVIRTLLETTRGDMRHLEELVTEFGANVHHLWVRRTERLPQAQRAIVEMLAAAGDIIEMNLLHDALAQLKQEGYFGANLKGLSDQGWVQRVVQMGSVRVGLSDLSLGDHMLRGFEAAQRKRLHEALYRAALEGDEQDGEASMYFVARHALEAGAIEVALEYGVRAARQLFGEGALEEAAELLDALLQYAEADILRGELHAMSADIWARLGRWRRALRHCGCLKRHVGGARGRAELDLRTASLLVKMGRYETAAKVLDGGLARFEEEPLSCEVGARLATERGEVALKLNDYERAAMSAKRAEKILGGECEPSAPRVSVCAPNSGEQPARQGLYFSGALSASALDLRGKFRGGADAEVARGGGARRGQPGHCGDGAL